MAQSAILAERTDVEGSLLGRLLHHWLSPEVQHIAGQHGMRIAATDSTGEVRAIERVDHRFFVGTLYQPQLRTVRGSPHPVFLGLLDAARASM